MENSKIQWTDHTWNVAVGCTKVDEDCKYCYMYRDSLDSKRFDPKVVRKTSTVFNMPLKKKEPARIFTSSYTDFFHEDIDSFRDEAWDIIRKCPQHTFQILTKRPDRIIEHLPEFWQEINGHVWLGTSIGSNAGLSRLMELVYPSKPMWLPRVSFLSLEPLYGELELPQKELSHMQWVIVGGESGNDVGKYRYRECKLEWIESIVNQCKEIGVPVFVKQLGTHLAKKLKLKDRHGGNIDEWPKHLQIRQFPK
jgi:protein gp37